MKYIFIVYNDSTNAFLRYGDVPTFAEVAKQAHDGEFAVYVPDGVLDPTGGAPNLAIFEAHSHAVVDADAERVRQQFITPGGGQALEYNEVRAELERYDAVIAASGTPVDSDYPFVAADAAARDMTLAASMDEVRAARDAWIVIGAKIRAARLAAKAAVTAATSLPTMAKAAIIDWAAVLAP